MATDCLTHRTMPRVSGLLMHPVSNPWLPGGYACGRARTQGPDSHTQTMKLYAGSKTTIEWTNQHGCGSNPKTSCEIVLQYACEDTLDATKKFRSKDSQWIGAPRDGTPETADTDAATDRIPDEEGAAKADTVKNRSCCPAAE